MKKSLNNTKRTLQYAALGLLLHAACSYSGQPAQAQTSNQNNAPGSKRVLLPEAQKRANDSYSLARIAAADLHAHNFAQAEVEAREAVEMEILPGVADEVLANVLNAQGKGQEAIEIYHTMIIDEGDRSPRNLLPYSQLLLKSGQWEQALEIYNQAIAQFPEGQLAPVGVQFSPDIPATTALAVAIHLEQGRLYNAGNDWAGNTQDTEAIAEYTKALQLAPDNALTNYFYGVGWQKLSPAERAKFGTVQQAKAHLQKAVKTGNANVKAAAQKVLKELG